MINVVWLKRDLRVRDHEPLFNAQQNGNPVVLLYVVEPLLLADPHMDLRHWRFIYQSIEDINEQLAYHNGAILFQKGDICSILQKIKDIHGSFSLFSHQEIGLNNTFERDKLLSEWCSINAISWIESKQGAVLRGLRSREKWDKHWYKQMRAPTIDVDLDAVNWVSNSQLASWNLTQFTPPIAWKKRPALFQLGGEKRAWHTLHHFFRERGKDYAFNISSPEASRRSCSRMSPYLAWGNISLRQMYQRLLQDWQRPGWRRSLSALSSRLHWHCHFIQKYESESEMEFRPVNRGYLSFPFREDRQRDNDVKAWYTGRTGIPLVDACMRCLHQTGYINFRMRAMLVSFLVHYLNIDWKEGVVHLAKVFLDFEPGIHYPQFQMQAGVTGINLIRVYSPSKQAKERDPEASFIKKWCPELSALPTELAHEPWLMSPMEQQMYQVELGIDYPNPIVDLQLAAKEAKDRLWRYRERDDVKAEGWRILQRHTVPETRHKYRRG